MYDLTLPIQEGMLSPGEGGFELRPRKSHEEHGSMATGFCMTAHDGTHIDAPLHYDANGRSVDQLTVEECTGSARVFDLRAYAGELITADVLDEGDPGISAGDRVVLLTGDTDAAFKGDRDYPEAIQRDSAALSVDAAEWLVEKGVTQIANDFLTESVSASQWGRDPERPVHRTILGADITVVEYICNTDQIVDLDPVEFNCYPLPIVGREASPARVLAREL